MSDKVIDEIADEMHTATYKNGKHNIPRSGYSRDYQESLLKQAKAAFEVVKKHYDLKEKV